MHDVKRLPRAVLPVLLALVATAAYADPWGVPLDRRAVRSEISPAGDRDAFLVEAPIGARIDVRVALPKSSGLLATAQLIGPSGPVADAIFAPAGRGLRLKRFTAPETGRYEIRVEGEQGTAGAFRVSAKVRGSGDLSLRDLSIGSGQEGRLHFAAGGGARVSFSVRGGLTAPTFVRIESPIGTIVPIAEGAVSTRVGILRGKKITLPDALPYGRYALVLSSPSGALQGMRARVRVKGGGLDGHRGALAGAEPVITAVTPQEAGDGTIVRLVGRGFVLDPKRPIRVFFGGVEAQSPTFDDAMSLRASFPPDLSGRVDVALLNGDGHAVVVEDAVLAVLPPRPTRIEPSRGPGLGGTVTEVHGSQFREGVAVTVAGTPFPENTEFVSETLLLFTTPPFAGGVQAIGVRDPTDQTGSITAGFDFVPPPLILEMRPPLVPAVAGAEVRLVGGDLSPLHDVTIGGLAPTAIGWLPPLSADLTLPLLVPGHHDVAVEDAFGQRALLPNGLTVFTYAAGPGLADTGGAAPVDLALADFDADGDLDAFCVSPGGATLSAEPLLRVLRNDGEQGWTDVSADVLPAITVDDWRASTIAFGDVAADVGETPPDSWPDIVIGSLDDSVLPDGRSRVRVLANRAAIGGGRHFVDRTEILMAATTQHDEWRAEDLWIGDIDGDGGVDDILATHDEIPFGESPLAPYYVYHLSGTRMFSFALDEVGTYGRFGWRSKRFPQVIGTRQVVPNIPTCVGNECADDYTPFRGTSLAVDDFDGDGRMDVAVTRPEALDVQGRRVASTQLARNIEVQGVASFEDRSGDFSVAIQSLAGDIILSGDVAGSPDPDLVIVSRTTSGAGIAVSIAQFRGFGQAWGDPSDELLPAAAGAERLQADAAQLVDVDGDGDLDIVLLTSSAPGGVGRGLRILRNRGERGFDRVLEDLLPAATAQEPFTGAALALGDLDDDGGFDIVLARDGGATGTPALSTVKRDTGGE